MDSATGADDMTSKEKSIPSNGGEKRKREMKTPYQLEILEQAYAAEAYPPESTRTELSEKIELSERQIQMWFCHRRLKDRKFEPNKRVKLERESNVMVPASSSYSGIGQTRGISYEAAPVAQSQLSATELKIIALVEAQIGGTLREDGPKLGVEFEPLPPGAFGAPIVITPQQKQPKQSCNSQLFNRNHAAAIKPVSRPPHDYQVLYEHPNTRPETYEKLANACLHDISVTESSTDAPIGLHKVNVLVDPHLSSNKTFKKPVSRPPHDYQVLYEHPNTRPETYEKLAKARLHDILVTESSTDAPIGLHKVNVLEDPHLSSNKSFKKSNTSRFQSDVELHEHHTRTNIDNQKIPYGKKEKRLRREMERLERERRKEEERMLHEKMREQERLLRDQKRENERRERFLQKENKRAEKMRQKEEIRREKEEARLKAAQERANARKIAKGDTELIEDECLELMTLAASNMGLPSVMALDTNTLQQLDMFRDKLSAFPPKSLQFTHPFATQPWTGSEENVANFLMVWKFLITFANIFGLRPFTMDEFLQSLHDYDSKLLGEIHVAMLNCIIKDIEDAAKPSIPNAVNQVSASNGGHQQIIEGAYTWGFNIHSWENHLNLLTWPEILRQFALSAGFGPQLKKKTAECDDEKEGDNSDDIISKLRNGLAAENAVLQMHEKGYSLGRKSRHRMTPGTLKFAAYHVLSLEGTKGLTLSELAEKIQRYGLRDLTGKTPETSIGVALSRDNRLFERIAPSTYRVQSGFRKDPSDADNLLSVARQKILASQNGILDLELAEKEVDDANDVEIDEDSESCGDVGAEIDILSTDANLNNNLDDPKELKNSKESPLEVGEKLEVSIKPIIQSVSNIDVEVPVIDESNFGEPWVKALTTGEYSDLSVEERLNALVALTNVVIEGNSIRVILEERFEAAYALKKQMWASAQLGKRRSKDEHLSKDDPALFMNSVSNDQNNAHNNIKEFFINPDSNQPQLYPYSTEKSRCNLNSYIAYKAEQLCEYRCLPLGQDRRHNRYWMFSVSTSPNEAGSGRIFFESKDGTWGIIDTEEAFDALLSALDTCGIRESHLHYMLQRIEPTFKESVRRNSIKSANSENLDKSIITGNVSSELTECPVSFSIESGTNEKERDGILKRYNTFVDSLWKECYNPAVLCSKKYDKRCSELMQTCQFCYCCYLSEERHCPSCHRTFKSIYNIDEFFLQHASHCGGKQIMKPDWIADVPIKIELLKAQLCLAEAFFPSEALQSFWDDGYRNSWGMKLNASKSPEDILHLVASLEHGIKKVFLPSNPETANKQSGKLTLGAVSGKDGSISGTIPSPWIPTTAAAVALRILELDVSVTSAVHKKLDSNTETETADPIKSSSKLTSVNGMTHEEEASVAPEQANYQSKGRAPCPRGGRPRGGRPRGRGGRTPNEGSRSSKLPKSTTHPNLGICKSTPRTCTKRGRTRGRGVKSGQWGRSSLMPRHLSEEQFGNFDGSQFNFKQVSLENSPQSYVGNNRAACVEDEENNSFRSRSDENEMVLGDELNEENSNYAVNRAESLDDYSDEDGEDAYTYDIQNNGAPLGNKGVDDDYSSEYSG